MAYVDRISAQVIGSRVAFHDANLEASAEIQVSATVAGVVESDIAALVTPRVVRSADRVKFAFRTQIPQGQSGETLASGLEAITFAIQSTRPLSPMGSHAVGYWLPVKPGLNPIEAFLYDFGDIARLFQTPVPGLVRERDTTGAWTGRMVPGTIQRAAPCTIEIRGDDAIITFSVRGVRFAAGQVIDLDPIAQTGSVLTYNGAGTNSGTVSTAITVPADADLVIAGATTYQSVVGYISTGGMTFTKGGTGTAMVNAASEGDTDTNAFMVGTFYLLQPDTGANKTLTWDFAGTSAPAEEVLFTVGFFKGINTSTPVRDSDAQQASALPYTTPTLTAQSGDLIVAIVGGYVGAEGTINSWSNLTEITEITANGSADSAWASGSPSGNTTVAASTGTNFDDGGICAIVLIPAAVGGATISPGGVASGEVFGTAKINRQVRPTALASAEAFGSGRMVMRVTPAGIGSSEALGTPRLNLRLLLTGIVSGEAFGTATLRLYLLPAGIASAEAHGTPVVGQITAIAPSAIPSAEAFGTGQLHQQVRGTGISTAEALGALRLALRVDPSGIPSSEAFGSARLALVLRPGAIGSAEAFGTLRMILQILPEAIASAEAFGTPGISQGGILSPSGIASAEAFGTGKLNQQIRSTAIGSGEAFGSARVRLYLLPAGIPTAEAVGSSSLRLYIVPASIASQEAFGTPRLRIFLLPAGIASAEAVGTAKVNFTLLGQAIASSEAFGTLRIRVSIAPSGIASAEVFGTATITGGQIGAILEAIVATVESLLPRRSVAGIAVARETTSLLPRRTVERL